jgi:hypothetical protein
MYTALSKPFQEGPASGEIRSDTRRSNWLRSSAGMFAYTV